MQTLRAFHPKGRPSARNPQQPKTPPTPEIARLSCPGRSTRPIAAAPRAAAEGEKTTEGEARLNVQALARRLWDSKSADDVEEVLGGVPAIHPRVHSSMIKGLGIDKKLPAALALVEWLKRRKGNSDESAVPNTIIYNSLLGAVRQSGDYAWAELVVSDMAQQGILPDIITYNTLMHISIEKGEPDEARRLLASIKEKGISPSAATYSTALLAYQKSGDASGALKFFLHLKGALQGEEEWEAELVKLRDFTLRICFQAMRRWLVEGGNQTGRILELFSDLDTAGLSWGRAELERLAWACTEESHHSVAKELYRRIRNMEGEEEAGGMISLSVCNHVIWVMGKAKKWWAALEIYEDLLDKGPKPNNLSYELIVSHFNVLLAAARRRGIWRWGLRILGKMKEKGLRVGAREWNAVLLACSKAGETRAAVEIFKRMVEQGEKPTAVSYGALLSALEKGGLYEEARRVWDHMRRVGVEGNVHTYTIMASVCAGGGRLEEVEAVVREMRAAGVAPSVVTFNAIISACARRGLGGAALEWFNRMKAGGTEPDEITYEMVVEALSREGKGRLALEVYLRGCREGLSLSSKAYDAVAGCGVGLLDMEALGPRPVAGLPRTGPARRFSL